MNTHPPLIVGVAGIHQAAARRSRPETAGAGRRWRPGLVFCWLMIVIATLWSSLTLAALPSSAAFEVDAVGDTETMTFTVDDETGLDDPRVTLCVPDCNSPNALFVNGSGTVADGASTWTLQPVGNCVSGSLYSCEVSVSYTAGDDSPGAAELVSVTGDPEVFDSVANLFFDRATLTGRVVEPPFNPGFVQFTSAQHTVEEGGEVLILVERVGGADGELVMEFEVFDRSRDDNFTASPDDYNVTTPTNGLLVWREDDSDPKPITLAAVADGRPEGDEDLAIVLRPVQLFAQGARGGSGSLNATNVTITDPVVVQNPGSVQFVDAAYSVTEGAGEGFVRLVVSRAGGSDGFVEIDYRFLDGSATLGLDYSTVSDGPAGGRLSWADNDSSLRTIDIPISDDGIDEDDETFRVELSLVPVSTKGGVQPTLGAPDSALVTIEDAAPLDTLSFVQASYRVEEGAGFATIDVERSGSGTGSVSVVYAITAGTASADLDYASGDDVSSFNPVLRWSDGQSGIETIDIPILDDTLDEQAETFTVTLRSPSGATLASPTSTTITIDDNDEPPITDTVRFATASVSQTEGDGTVRLVVQRISEDDGSGNGSGSGSGSGSGASRAVTVTYALAAGTASVPTDLVPGTPQSGTLTWPAGDTDDRVIEVGIVNDNEVESNETFSVSLLQVTGATLATPARVNVTILDDDVVVPDQVRFTATSASVSEIEGSLRLAVERVSLREGASQEPVSVDYALAGNTASLQADLTSQTPLSGTLSWPAGDTTVRFIDIGVVDDDLVETDETLSVTLSDPEGADLGAPAAVTVTLVSDDVSTPGVLSFDPIRYVVAETAELVVVNVTRTDGSDEAASVDWTLTDETAEAGADFAPAGAARSGTLNWAAGDSRPRTITIGIVDDGVAEEDETFRVTLANASGATLGQGRIATVVIGDVTPAVPDLISFAAASASVDESDGRIRLAVQRSGDAQTRGDGPASVAYTLAAGTASLQQDLASGTATSGTLTWADGDSADKFITITVRDDDEIEDDETFTVTLATPAGADAGSPTTATVTIVNDDIATPGTINFAPARYSIGETDGQVTLTVVRTGGSDGAATVRWTAADRSARAGEDYAVGANAARTDTVTWRDGDTAARTITIDIADDGIAEPAETFVVTLSRVSGASLGNAVAATVTINDETPLALDQFSFATAAIDVSETDGSVRLAVQRSGGGAGLASVGYRLEGGSASLADDLAVSTAVSGTLRWANNDTADKFIDIGLFDDALVESPERFSVMLIEPFGGTLGTPALAEITLTSDDQPDQPIGGTVAFAATTQTVVENAGQVQIAIERSGGNDGELAVNFATENGTALAGQDYTAASGTVRWANGESGIRRVTVNITADAVVESDEQFLVRLGDATLAGEPLAISSEPLAVTITDTTRVGTLSALDVNPELLESDGEAVIRIARNAGSDGELRARYMTVEQTALEGEDFTGVEGELVWADGERGVRELRVPLVNDGVAEPDETFLVRFIDVPTTVTAFRMQAIGDIPVTVIDDDRIDGGGPGDDVDALAELGALRLAITAGGDQSGMSGDILDTMAARVIDEEANNDPRANVPVRWRVNPPGSAELLDGPRSVSDETGQVFNRVRVLSRGFVNVVATIDVTGTSTNGDAASGTPRSEPGEVVFIVRAGFEAATGLTRTQSRTGAAVDTACATLGEQIAAGGEVSPGEFDLFETCRQLDTRLLDGQLAPALDRLAPEEIFAISDSIVDLNDIKVTNVFQRINAIRRGQREAFDLAGLGVNLYGERIPGQVVEAAKDALVEHAERRRSVYRQPSGGGASADSASFEPPLGVFVNGSVSFGEVDSDGNQADADVSTRGVTVGADYRFRSNIVAGVGLGIVANETEFTSNGGTIDVDGLALTVFGTYYERDSGYLDAVLDIGRNDYDVRRRMNLSGNNQQFGMGQTSASVMSLTFSAGKDYRRGPWEFGPYTRGSLTRAEVDGYSERASNEGPGFGSVLDISAHSVNSARLSIGGQVSRAVSTRRGVIVPQLRVEAEFETESAKDTIRARFQNDPSRTPIVLDGDAYDSGYLNLGLGGSGVFANGRSAYLFYETRMAHRYVTQHWVKAGLRFSF